MIYEDGVGSMSDGLRVMGQDVSRVTYPRVACLLIVMPIRRSTSRDVWVGVYIHGRQANSL